MDGLDRRVDDLLRRLSDELSVEPSRDFSRRVRTEAARRGVRAAWATRLLSAIAAVLLFLPFGSWWTGRTPSSQAPSTRAAVGAPAAGPAARSTPSTDQGATARVTTGSSPLVSSVPLKPASSRTLREEPRAAERRLLTHVTLSHVGEFQVPMWTVEVAEPFATVTFTPPPIATVAFVPVEFHRVILPGLETMTPSPPVDRGGRETP